MTFKKKSVKFKKKDKSGKEVNVEISKKDLEDWLDSEVAHSVSVLKNLDPESEEYAKVVKNVKAVNDVKSETSNKVNINTVIPVVGSIVSVLAIIVFEKFGNGIFTSKAAGFIMKPRV